MHQLRTIIVDDEELARGLLREHLAPHPDIEIIAECANGFDAVKSITELKPELVFLDIQMPKLNGFEVLELIDHQPSIIFVTAFDHYAVKAFEVHAVDYLLKPFSPQRLQDALTRVRQTIATSQRLPFDGLLSDVREHGTPLERILIRDGSRVHVLSTDKLNYIEAQDDYAAFKTEGKTYLKQQRLAQLEQLLDNRKFVRIHRSYILNVDRIVKLELVPLPESNLAFC